MNALRTAYLVDAVRTPIGKHRGALSAVRSDDLAAHVVTQLLARKPGLSGRVDHVVFGATNQAGEDNRNVARMALLLAGVPDSVPGATVNRLCGSGLDALAIGARSIACGEAELILAGGVESMTRAPYVMAKSDQAFGRGAKLEDTTLGWRLINPAMKAKYGVDAMGETAENVAAEYRVARADQDAFALRSQQRHAQALAAGFFEGELVPVAVPRGKGEPVQVSADEHPRADTTAEGLARLKPVIRPDGTVTAGNASGINDGACALLLASEAAVKTHGLKPRGRVLGCATAGVPPRIMGIGPVPATRKLLARTGLETGRIDVFEFNEAFAAQALAVVRELGIADDDARVNPNGGAIAIGHPLGASGARLATTALRQLERSGGRYGVASMCIGVGQGIAMLIERV